MARYSLATYTIRIKDKVRDIYVPINNIQNGTDFLNVMDNYLSNRHMNMAHQQAQRKLLKIRNFTRQNRVFSGIVETGEYGYEAELLDVNSSRTTHRSSVSEAEMLPFYFLIFLTQNTDEGILILQRFKQYGIRTIFGRDINEYISSQFHSLELQINPLVPSRLINEYLNNGRILKLRFIRFSFPPDIADAYDTQYHVEEEGYTEYVISAKRRGSIPILGRILEVLNGQRQLNELIEIQSFEYDKVKVEVDLNGNKRTIDLSDMSKLRAYIDVSQSVRLGNDGHPLFESIDEIAQGLLQDLWTQIRGNNNVQ